MAIGRVTGGRRADRMIAAAPGPDDAASLVHQNCV